MNRPRITTRTAFGVVAGVAAMGALAQLALASTERASSVRAAGGRSSTFAGLDLNGYIGVPGAVSAVIVVPKLDCAGTPSGGSAIDVGVGIQSVSSYARLELACTSQGAASYYPSLVVNGAGKRFPDNAAQAGDTVELAVSQSVSKVTVSVIDLTRRLIATSNGNGSGTSAGIAAGAFPAVSGSTSAMPDFGTLNFSSALINGFPFGFAGKGLQVDDLAATGPLQIKTIYSNRNKEAFAVVFKHS